MTAVLGIQGHFTADQLYLRLERKNPRASRATVYRTLEHLVGSGLVDKVDLGGQQAFYENFYGREHHDHLICLGCGEIIEFTSRAIEELQDSVCREHQFEARSHSHKILGHCRKCH
ncbi:MAG: transcriptional repressor [Candidatus Rokubacteria bacterium]|nr:transcriptional repressor [Candidatus Rokubacteria bacterium]